MSASAVEARHQIQQIADSIQKAVDATWELWEKTQGFWNDGLGIPLGLFHQS